MIRFSEALKGVVLEMFGTGNGPTSPSLLDAIREADTKGIVVVAVTQCVRGGVAIETVRLLIVI